MAEGNPLFSGIAAAQKSLASDQQRELAGKQDARAEATAEQQMRLRGVDIARRQSDLDKQKMDIQTTKFTQIMDATQRIAIAKKGSIMHKVAVTRLDNLSRGFNFAIPKESLEAMGDEQVQQDLLTNIAAAAGLKEMDQEGFNNVMSTWMATTANPAEMIQKLAENSAKTKQQEADANQKAALAKDKALTAKQTEVTKRSDKVIDDWKKDKRTIRTQELNESWAKMQAASGEAKFDKDFITRATAAGMDTANFDSNAFDQLALIFNFIRIQDPGSTVREGEFLLAEKSTPLAKEISRQWNKIKTGKRLTDEFVQELMTSARGTVLQQRAQQNKTNFRAIAEARGKKLPIKPLVDSMGLSLTRNMIDEDRTVLALMRLDKSLTEQDARQKAGDFAKARRLAKARQKKQRLRGKSGATR